MSRRERNYPLYLGAILSFFFVLLALIGPRLAPHDPMYAYDSTIVVGQLYLPTSNPPAPFQLAPFPLGTDEVGRDILSRLLWAFRPTLLLCLVAVAARLAAGLPLGLIAGWRRGSTGRVIDLLIGASVAIPALVFCVAAVSFLGVQRGLISFVVALSLTGWADIAAFVKARAQTIVQEPYIESARAVGLRSRTILRRYLFPQLWPVLPALIAFELSAVALLVAEMGFLGVFIGGGFVYQVARGDSLESWQMMTEGYPEFGQMLSRFWAKIILVPWQPLIVGSVVFLMILAFNLLGEGLRRQMDITRR